VDHRHRGLVV